MNFLEKIKANLSLNKIAIVFSSVAFITASLSIISWGVAFWPKIRFDSSKSFQFEDRIVPEVLVSSSEEEYFINHAAVSIFSREGIEIKDFGGELYNFDVSGGNEKYAELIIPLEDYGKHLSTLQILDSKGNTLLHELNLSRVFLYDQTIETDYIKSGSGSSVISNFDISTLLTPTQRIPITYVPSNLVELSEYEIDTLGSQFLVEEAAESLAEINTELKKIGIGMVVTSAFRSYQYQNYTYNFVKANEGEAAAKSKVAIPGFSEHQVGLAVDIVNEETNYRLPTPGTETRLYNWMKENGEKYGFVQTYKESDEEHGIIEEIWHWRYIGKPGI